MTYRNLRRVQKSPIYQQDKEFRIFTGGLIASFGAYLVGAFFVDTAYNLFPYFLVAYTTGLYRIAYPLGRKRKEVGANQDREASRASEPRKELVWNR